MQPLTQNPADKGTQAYPKGLVNKVQYVRFYLMKINYKQTLDEVVNSSE